MEVESQAFDRISSPTHTKPRRYRASISDWAGLLKSIIWEKLFWGPEIPNKETRASLLRAEDDIKNGRYTAFSNGEDAVAWLRDKIKEKE